MRTTIDLPDDLHRAARSIAHDEGRTMSEVVALLMRRGLGQGEGTHIGDDPLTGLPSVRLGTTITSEDVRALDDEP